MLRPYRGILPWFSIIISEKSTFAYEHYGPKTEKSGTNRTTQAEKNTDNRVEAQQLRIVIVFSIISDYNRK